MERKRVKERESERERWMEERSVYVRERESDLDFSPI